VASHAPSSVCSIADIAYACLLIQVTRLLDARSAARYLAQVSQGRDQILSAGNTGCGCCLCQAASSINSHNQQVPQSRGPRGQRCTTLRNPPRRSHIGSAELPRCALKVLSDSVSGPVLEACLRGIAVEHWRRRSCWGESVGGSWKSAPVYSRLACALLHVAARWGPGVGECCNTCRPRMCRHASGGRILRAPSYQAYCAYLRHCPLAVTGVT
jgi:bacterioferritin-associated ferredoxin